MLTSQSRHAWVRQASALVLFGLAAAAGCKGTTDPDSSTPLGVQPATPSTTITPNTAERSRLVALRRRFQHPPDSGPNGVLAAGPARSFSSTSGGLRVREWDRNSLTRTAQIVAPAHADAPITLTDETSGMRVAITLEGAAASAPILVDGLLLYPAAAPGGGDVVLRADHHGVEDYVLVARPPHERALHYRLDVRDVAGLRLVANSLEMLDAAGIPRLRVAPPYVMDAHGKRWPAQLTVRGCAVDNDPRAPWGRAPTAPNAQQCVVAVRWPSDVRYPVLIDPDWESTSNKLAVARRGHSATVVDEAAGNSVVLVAGGFDAAGNGLSSAELYHAAGRVFSVTSSMSVARGQHAAAAVTFVDGQAVTRHAVVVSGGRGAVAGTPHQSIEVYDASSGVFAAFAGNDTARVKHTATTVVLDPAGACPGAAANAGLENSVLLVGGFTSGTTPTASTSLLTITDIGAGMVTGTLTAVDALKKSARADHAAVRLSAAANGNVLVTGGLNLAGAALNSAELFDVTSCTFGEPIPPSSPSSLSNNMGEQRSGHTATLLDDGDVFITGGVKGGLFLRSTDRYNDGINDSAGFEFQTTLSPMFQKRGYHTATRLATGHVLIVGGRNAAGALASSEEYDPGPDVANASFSQPAVNTALLSRFGHRAVLVHAQLPDQTLRSEVLVLGGEDGSGPVDTAQLFVKRNGEPCTIFGECESGVCVEGVCCNDNCAGRCFSCRLAKTGQPDGLCSAVLDNTPLPQICVNDVQVSNKCDGLGNEVPAGAVDCKPNTCDAAGFACETDCTSDADCHKDAWCDPDAAANGSGGAGGSGGGGSLGACVDKKENGTPCTGGDGSNGDGGASAIGGGNQCKSGFCYDGVCCNIACDKLCLFCSPATGICASSGVDGDHIPRKAGNQCPGDLGTACSGTCGANSVDACKYPDSTVEDGAPSCVCDDTFSTCELTTQLCNGAGTSEPSVSSCQGFRCASDVACLTTCNNNDDCVEDFQCDGSICVAFTTPTCDDDAAGATLLMPAAADVSCAPFRCADGACPNVCKSVDDCVAPAVCNSAGECVDQITAPEVAGCSCRVAASAGPHHNRAWLLVLVVGLAFSRRRSRRSGQVR